MKSKFFIPIFFSVLIGFIFGKIVFNQYENTTTTFGNGEAVYFVQIGVYSNINSIKENLGNLDNYLYILENNAYHVYAGLSKNEKIASNIASYYEKKGNNTFTKKKMINNLEFTTLLGEYDKVLEISSKDSDIEIVQKVVISSYKEMVLNE